LQKLASAGQGQKRRNPVIYEGYQRLHKKAKRGKKSIFLDFQSSALPTDTFSSSQLHHAPTGLWIFVAYYYKYGAPTERWATANGAVPCCKWYKIRIGCPKNGMCLEFAPLVNEPLIPVSPHCRVK
jgi:hypothetical protein